MTAAHGAACRLASEATASWIPCVEESYGLQAALAEKCGSPTGRSVSLPADDDEETLYSQPSKLYYFYRGKWREGGSGQARLLRCRGIVRFTHLDGKSKRCLANHSVAGCELMPNAGSDRCWVWTAQDCAQGELRTVQLGLKFATVELALTFREAFNEAGNLLGADLPLLGPGGGELQLWQYVCGDEWLRFERAASETLENAYVQWMRWPDADFEQVVVSSGRHAYRVDFARMQQVNTATCMARSVRRIAAAVADELAEKSEQIERQNAELLEKQQLLEELQARLPDLEARLDDEIQLRLSSLPTEAPIASEISSNTFRYLKSLVLKAVAPQRASREPPRLEVLSIRGVCSADPLSAYTTYRNALLRQRPGGCGPLANVGAPLLGRRLNEYLLFHGAAPDAAVEIARAGFDAQRGGERHDGRRYSPLFGVGSYFADLASKADAYAAPDASGTRTLLLARVLLGEAYVAREPMRERQRAPDGYHSICGATVAEGGALEHREYVVFKDPQALPLFAVSYRHADGCPCSVCTR